MAAIDDLLDLRTPGTTKSGLVGGDVRSATSPGVNSVLGSAGSGAGGGTSAGYTPSPFVAFNPNTLPAALANDDKYKNIIGSNPDYMAWALQAGERADTGAANRRAAMRALAIRFGGLPGGFSDVYGDIDPETQRIASENQVSEQARMLRAYQDQIESNRRSLAARGMLQSGDLGFSQNQLDTQRGADVYDLNNQFLDAAQGSLNDYAGLVAGLNAEQIDQIRAAAQAAYESGLYPNPPPPGGNPPPPPGGTGTTAETPEQRAARLALGHPVPGVGTHIAGGSGYSTT